VAGLPELRWAMARPDPATGSQTPTGGFGGGQLPVLAVAPPSARGIGGATAYLPTGRTGARRCHRFRECNERPVETEQCARLSLPSIPQRKGQERGRSGGGG
jgi:hypothetical protein